MIKKLSPFTWVFIGVMIAAYFLQLYLLQLEYDKFYLLSAYIVNFLIAYALIFLILFYLQKLKNYIGFIFLGGSLVKFAVFFLFFYPYLTTNGEIKTISYALFFVPYLICLFFETYKLGKVLNSL